MKVKRKSTKSLDEAMEQTEPSLEKMPGRNPKKTFNFKGKAKILKRQMAKIEREKIKLEELTMAALKKKLEIQFLPVDKKDLKHQLKMEARRKIA